MKNDPTCSWCNGEECECACDVSAVENLRSSILGHLGLLPGCAAPNDLAFGEMLNRLGNGLGRHKRSGPECLYALALRYLRVKPMTAKALGLAHIYFTAAKNLYMLEDSAEEIGNKLIAEIDAK